MVKDQITTEQTFKVSEVELSYKPCFKPSERPNLGSSHDVYKLLKSGWNPGKLEFIEQFKLLLLNRGNRVLGLLEVSSGGVAGTVADPKVIFAAALKASASSIILAHNHPSGQLKPSSADIALTNKLKRGGELLDIQVLDHLILSSEGYYSFGDEGIM